MIILPILFALFVAQGTPLGAALIAVIGTEIMLAAIFAFVEYRQLRR
ncbi:MAG TPA: hypothetical protein VKY31_15890 [Terriglobia bacterium]|nr:hypothetical protein [Terriglobia bacterium]